MLGPRAFHWYAIQFIWKWWDFLDFLVGVKREKEFWRMRLCAWGLGVWIPCKSVVWLGELASTISCHESEENNLIKYQRRESLSEIVKSHFTSIQLEKISYAHTSLSDFPFPLCTFKYSQPVQQSHQLIAIYTQRTTTTTAKMDMQLTTSSPRIIMLGGHESQKEMTFTIHCHDPTFKRKS